MAEAEIERAAGPQRQIAIYRERFHVCRRQRSAGVDCGGTDRAAALQTTAGVDGQCTAEASLHGKRAVGNIRAAGKAAAVTGEDSRSGQKIDSARTGDCWRECVAVPGVVEIQTSR